MRCVALFSGGLDSQTAARLMQLQGIEVEAVHVSTPYAMCSQRTIDAAAQLGMRLHQRTVRDDYLQVLEYPRFGYGKGANPCLDCRIYMARMAREVMQQIGADFAVTGEVLGQRPMSQKRRDLDVVAYHSGLDDLLLRPLCAKLLPPTRPEREGWVDRQQLYGFSGRRRQELVQLATTIGVEQRPQPSTGCALTERLFGIKVFDLLATTQPTSFWDYESLRYGRHFRLRPDCKVIVGRNLDENHQLRNLHAASDARSTAVMVPRGFGGPTALIVGPADDEAIGFAGGLILRYARNKCGACPTISVADATGERIIEAAPIPDAQRAVPLGTQL